MARAKSIIDLFKAVTKTSPKKKSVQKELRKKELKDRVQKPTEEDPRKKAVRNKQQSVVKAAQRRAKTADRSKKDQKVAARVLPAVSGVRNKVEGMSVTDLGNKFTGPELKSMEMKLKQATNPNKTLLNKLKEARDYRIGMEEAGQEDCGKEKAWWQGCFR